MTELITKRCQQPYFSLVASGGKNVEARIADFSVEVGDWMELREYDPGTRTYSGASVQRQVVAVHHLTPEQLDAFGMTPEAMGEFGVYVIELQNPRLHDLESAIDAYIEALRSVEAERDAFRREVLVLRRR